MKDLIIIGAGPGGYELALEASKKGLSTVLIEASEVGGTCLHYGCIPTKSYYKTATVLKELNRLDEYGINGDFKFNFEKTLNRKEEIIATLTKGIKFLLSNTDVELVYGYAKLISKHQVLVNDQAYEANNIIIATGSSPSKLMLPGFDLDNVITSKELLQLKEVPKKLTIIGGGVVGIEFASIYNKFGSEVEVIEALDTILPNLDKEVSKRLQTSLKFQGIKIHLKSRVSKIESKINLKVQYNSKGVDCISSADKVLVSVGRTPNIANLGLDEIGIEYDKYGIKVNSSFQTNIENIYAIGDVTGKMMLAHSATYSGYHVLKHILNEVSNINFDAVPSCVFTFPEIATVGKTEEECKNLDYKVHKYYFKANGKAITLNEIDGFVKVITEGNSVLGVHIIGPHASDLIHEAVTMMNKNITIDEFKDYIHAHPTLSETFSSAIK